MQCLPSKSEYGGPRTSRTAHAVTAVKQCKLPPSSGYKIEGLQGAVKSSSTFTFANLNSGPATLEYKCSLCSARTIKKQWYMNNSFKLGFETENATTFVRTFP